MEGIISESEKDKKRTYHHIVWSDGVKSWETKRSLSKNGFELSLVGRRVRKKPSKKKKRRAASVIGRFLSQARERQKYDRLKQVVRPLSLSNTVTMNVCNTIQFPSPSPLHILEARQAPKFLLGCVFATTGNALKPDWYTFYDYLEWTYHTNSFDDVLVDGALRSVVCAGVPVPLVEMDTFYRFCDATDREFLCTM